MDARSSPACTELSRRSAEVFTSAGGSALRKRPSKPSSDKAATKPVSEASLSSTLAASAPDGSKPWGLARITLVSSSKRRRAVEYSSGQLCSSASTATLPTSARGDESHGCTTARMSEGSVLLSCCFSSHSATRASSNVVPRDRHAPLHIETVAASSTESACMAMCVRASHVSVFSSSHAILSAS